MGIALACCRYRSQPQASRLLPGRVHVPIQPAAIKKPRQALLPPRAASRSSRARSLGSDYSPRNQSQNETTTCRGYLSQADTPQDILWATMLEIFHWGISPNGSIEGRG